MEKYFKKIKIKAESILHNKILVIYILIFVATLIMYIPLLQGHYAVDTYDVLDKGYHNYAVTASLKDGRIVMFLITELANAFNIQIEMFIFITLFLALIISFCTVIVLKNIVEKYKKTDNIKLKILLIAITYITIFNFMLIETMYFVESFVMSLSI